MFMIRMGGEKWESLTMSSKIFVDLIRHTATLSFAFIPNRNKIKGYLKI